MVVSAHSFGLRCPPVLDGSLDVGSASRNFMPVNCGISSGAKGIRTPDLLDANESTWAFALVEQVGGAGKLHVTWLVTLASNERCRNYCGRAADERRQYMSATVRRFDLAPFLACLHVAQRAVRAAGRGREARLHLLGA